MAERMRVTRKNEVGVDMVRGGGGLRGLVCVAGVVVRMIGIGEWV
jgi:hypothetical protein